MTATKTREGIETVLRILPHRVCEEILALVRTRRGGVSAIREIRIRADARSTLLVGRDRIPLCCVLRRDELETTLHRLSEGSVYAYCDSIRAGYVTVVGGVRVGVCAEARYDGTRASVSGVSSLVFRIPTGECEFAERLYRIWDEVKKLDTGMLVYSPPGVGKTTALRSLAAYIGGGRDPRRVVIVDERCEFISSDYERCEVDILRGYHRDEGVAIAIRTMSPEVLIIDELGEEDAPRLFGTVRCGIPVLASAHAASLSELMARRGLSDMIGGGVFGVFVGIARSGDGYSLTVDGI